MMHGAYNVKFTLLCVSSDTVFSYTTNKISFLHCFIISCDLYLLFLCLLSRFSPFLLLGTVKNIVDVFVTGILTVMIFA